MAALRRLRAQVAAADVAAARQLPPLLFETDMDAGHFAASGAGDRLRARAKKLAFLLHTVGDGQQQR